ncbi:MAG: UTP--glucose-1-phosphate uridylyltransferase [Bacillota bacterium]|nr:UTP--glucose-1-phosphate uridylyltransferase [Bacillota bacterium]HHU43690.1 UTP--glucose-1-phosphate uridylyltransferase [Clostridiales bacterium]
MKVTRAIIPAAGYGTRFLPATKAMPKEMLPIVDVPSIQYIVEECVQSGITDVCIILGRNKNNIADHFDRNFEVESALAKLKKYEQIKIMNELSDKVNICYIRQKEMLGTGKAIELCQSFVKGEPFAVLFGDDVMYNPEYPVTKQLIDAYETTGLTIVGVQPQPREEAIKYGVIVPGKVKGAYTKILGFKEKPKIDELPSTLASLGRFILTPDIFEYIRRTPPAKNGEVYLPTAIEMLAKDIGAFAFSFEGKRYDIGDKLGYIKANIEFALRKRELKNALKRYLRDLVKNI